ncbi:MAG: hypothetical protein HY321_15420 [Armatimonadetes bacterium]|nr:hypothetical protein [Armatimonadota bacterium]
MRGATLKVAAGLAAVGTIGLAVILAARSGRPPGHGVVSAGLPSQGSNPLAVAPNAVPGGVKPLSAAPPRPPRADPFADLTASRPAAPPRPQRPLSAGRPARLPAAPPLAASPPRALPSAPSVASALPAAAPPPPVIGAAPESLTAGSFGIQRREEPADGGGSGLIIYNLKQDHTIFVDLRGPKTYEDIKVPPGSSESVPVVPGTYAISAEGRWTPRPGVRPGFIEAPFGEWEDSFSPGTRTRIWLTSRPLLAPGPPAESPPPAAAPAPSEDGAPGDGGLVVPVPED